MRRISGLEVRALPVWPSNNTQLASIDIKSADILPVGATLNFTIDVINGDVEYYLVRLNDQLYKNTTRNTFNLTFPEASTHTAGYLPSLTYAPL